VPTRRDEYVRHLHECSAYAANAHSSEISALWTSIAGSYRFLIEREDRLARELKEDGIGFYNLLP